MRFLFVIFTKNQSSDFVVFFAEFQHGILLLISADFTYHLYVTRFHKTALLQKNAVFRIKRGDKIKDICYNKRKAFIINQKIEKISHYYI